MIKDCTNFLNFIKDIESYFLKFDKNGTMKDKVYPSNCTVNDGKH